MSIIGATPKALMCRKIHPVNLGQMKRKVFYSVALLITLGVLTAVFVQHLHYQSIRQKAVQDRQPIFYDGESFHVLTFVRLEDGGDLITHLRSLHSATKQGAWIYAGKVINNKHSDQIGPKEWSGVVFAQYPSRTVYEEERGENAYREALGSFAEHYEMGMRRPALLNLLYPQSLLVNKVLQKVTFKESPYPFTPMNGPAPEMTASNVESLSSEGLSEDIRDGMEMITRLRAESDHLGRDAAVVVNINKHGTAEQKSQDALYTKEMTGLMAELGYGPIHLGDAEPLSNDHNFDRVVLVYYPGTGYFADLFTSTFFQSIIGDKQLGDNQSTITVPILELIDE